MGTINRLDRQCGLQARPDLVTGNHTSRSDREVDVARSRHTGRTVRRSARRPRYAVMRERAQRIDRVLARTKVQSLSAAHAPYIVVPKALRTIAEGPRGREDETAGVVRLLAPAIHRGAILGSPHIRPDPCPVRSGGDGIHVVTHELVV